LLSWALTLPCADEAVLLAHLLQLSNCNVSTCYPSSVWPWQLILLWADKVHKWRGYMS
jgi:hypothetical protein